MYLRAGSILRTNLSVPKFRTNRTAEVAGWLFLFGAAGIVYFFAQANNTWPWVKAFVAALFLVVILGIGWEWVLSRRSPANSRNAILAGVLFWLLLDPLVWREGIDEFSPDVIVRALLYAGIFIAAIYAVASLWIPLLASMWMMGGLAYGIAIFFVMTYVVVPLSAAPRRPPASLGKHSKDMLAMLGFGLIVAYAVYTATL